MLNNQFYFEHGVENGCVATVNLYEETVLAGFVARAFHPGKALVM